MKNSSDTSMKISLIFVKNTTLSRIILSGWTPIYQSLPVICSVNLAQS